MVQPLLVYRPRNKKQLLPTDQTTHLLNTSRNTFLEMHLTPYHPIIALWLITMLIFQTELSAVDTTLTLSVSWPEEYTDRSVTAISRF